MCLFTDEGPVCSHGWIVLPCPECWGLEKRKGVCNQENPGSAAYYLCESGQINLSMTFPDLVKWECLTKLPALWGCCETECLTSVVHVLAITVVMSMGGNV